LNCSVQSGGPWVSPRTDEKIILEGGGVRCGHRSWGFVSLVSLLERGICLRVCGRRYREDIEGVGSIALNLLMRRRAARQKTILSCASCCGDDKRNLRVKQSGEPSWGFWHIAPGTTGPSSFDAVIRTLRLRGLFYGFCIYRDIGSLWYWSSSQRFKCLKSGWHLVRISAYRPASFDHSGSQFGKTIRVDTYYINLGRSSASRILHHTPIYRLLVYGCNKRLPPPISASPHWLSLFAGVSHPTLTSPF